MYPYITQSVLSELREIYQDQHACSIYYGIGGCPFPYQGSDRAKVHCYYDEWDILIREEAMNQKVQDEYINLLKGPFKGSEPTKYIQLAWIGTQSALNNFDEFTTIAASDLASFVGFTEQEVKTLCLKYHKDFEQIKGWYDGYLLENHQVYNPIAVIGNCSIDQYGF